MNDPATVKVSTDGDNWSPTPGLYRHQLLELQKTPGFVIKSTEKIDPDKFYPWDPRMFP